MFTLEKAKKGYRAQKPLYKSIPEFVNLVSNHPELSRDANFPDDENDIDYIPESRLDDVDHVAQSFFNGRKRSEAAQPAKQEPNEEKGGERSEPPADE